MAEKKKGRKPDYLGSGIVIDTKGGEKMRSKEEIEEMENMLEQIVKRSPDECKAGVHETCEYLLAGLLWAKGEINANEIIITLLLSEKGRQVVWE